MPSVSKKQHGFMAKVATNPAFAKAKGISQSIGKEFLTADKGKKFEKGGEMKESKAMVKKEVSFMKKKGAPKSMIKHEESEMKGMKKGGVAASKMGKVASGGKRPHGEHSVQQKGHTKGKQVVMRKGGKACA